MIKPIRRIFSTVLLVAVLCVLNMMELENKAIESK